MNDKLIKTLNRIYELSQQKAKLLEVVEGGEDAFVLQKCGKLVLQSMPSVPQKPAVVVCRKNHYYVQH